MPINIVTQITGVSSVIANFNNMKRGARGVVTRKAVRAGNAPQRTAVKSTSLFTDRTGLLRRAAFVTVKTKRSGVTVGKVGAKTSLTGQRTSVSRWNAATGTVGVRSITVRPARYVHLVEDGHATRGGGRVRGRKFMKQAGAASAAAAQSRFRSKFIVEMVALIRAGRAPSP